MADIGPEQKDISSSGINLYPVTFFKFQKCFKNIER